jgi:hypothetical protein
MHGKGCKDTITGSKTRGLVQSASKESVPRLLIGISEDPPPDRWAEISRAIMEGIAGV